MSKQADPAPDQYKWERQPETAWWVGKVIEQDAELFPAITRLADALREETGTRLADWVDHLVFDLQDRYFGEPRMYTRGYRPYPSVSGTTPLGPKEAWRNRRGIFPVVLVPPYEERLSFNDHGFGIRVESIDDCLAKLPAALGFDEVPQSAVVGAPGSPFRHVCLAKKGTNAIWAVERHGYPGFTPQSVEPAQIDAAKRHLEAFRNRQRHFDAQEDGFAHASELTAAATDDVGTAWACDLFFIAEREYWQSRNAAARVQYERQNRLGLGWANHDHHTYRSSRRAFGQLVATLEQLGFECRERFYAGREAGWGAQVLEQPDCRFVVFADVDLSPEEVAGDFAHEPLAERDELGTVGLWCELHGEAFLDAGMHHLECQFDFDAARAQLADAGIETLAPFTDFPFLKQAFTRGEMWPVDSRRVERLLTAGRITADQAERFRRDGALGSHLEILERNDGYKGFNQTGVSDIIQRTDPRRMIGA